MRIEAAISYNVGRSSVAALTPGCATISGEFEHVR